MSVAVSVSLAHKLDLLVSCCMLHALPVLPVLTSSAITVAFSTSHAP